MAFFYSVIVFCQLNSLAANLIGKITTFNVYYVSMYRTRQGINKQTNQLILFASLVSILKPDESAVIVRD